MLEFARALRLQREQKKRIHHEQSSVQQMRAQNRNRRSKTVIGPLANKYSLICSLCSGSSLLSIGITLFVIGLQMEEKACIISGTVFSLFGLVILFIAVDIIIIIRKSSDSSGNKRNVVVSQKKKDTEIQDHHQSAPLATIKLREMPYVVTHPSIMYRSSPENGF